MYLYRRVLIRKMHFAPLTYTRPISGGVLTIKTTPIAYSGFGRVVKTYFVYTLLRRLLWSRPHYTRYNINIYYPGQFESILYYITYFIALAEVHPAAIDPPIFIDTSAIFMRPGEDPISRETHSIILIEIDVCIICTIHFNNRIVPRTP